MANYDIAHKLTALYEGGYNKGKLPSYGETYKGIDRTYSNGGSNWEGWKIIDAYKAKFGGIREEGTIKDSNLDNLVKNFNYTKYWMPSKTEFIGNQKLANLYFDFYYHKPAIAVKAMGDICKTINPALGLSESTIAAINANPAFVYAEFWKLRIAHYSNRYRNPPRYTSSQKGVLNRAKAFPPTI